MPLAKRIIPCLDVDDGRVVKGVNFVDIRDAGDPVKQARFYDEAGADELVFLDITATHEGRGIMHDVVRRTADQVFIPLTVGGGLRSVDDMRAMLHAGADKVAINSAAVKDPDLITEGAEAFGAQCIVVAIDAKRVGDGWEVFVHGGRKPTGLDAITWAVDAEARGAGELLVTSMDRDGTKDGYDVELLRAISRRVRIPVIAWSICATGSWRGKRMPYWPPRSSTFVSMPLTRPSAFCMRPASPSASPPTRLPFHMPDAHSMHPATLLRAGAAVFVLIGGSITVWLADKAFRYPEIQASQFGNTAPLWIPTILFVVVATAAGAYVLTRAARRVDEGDDLFADRHRRRPSDDTSSSSD